MKPIKATYSREKGYVLQVPNEVIMALHFGEMTKEKFCDLCHEAVKAKRSR